MKKIVLSAALVAMMGLSLVSCKETAKEPQPAATEEKVEPIEEKVEPTEEEVAPENVEETTQDSVDEVKGEVEKEVK